MATVPTAAPTTDDRGLTRAAALWWGLQFSLLNPVLALLLVEVYGASAAQVGTVLVINGAASFVAALVVPVWADRRGDYLRPLLACAVLTVALAAALLAVSGLPAAVVALVVLGGPASVGTSLLFAHLRYSGASRERVASTRAWSSAAWVAGPPLATLAISWVGQRSVLWLLMAVALVNAGTTALLVRRAPRAAPAATSRVADPAQPAPSSRRGRAMAVGVVVVAFVLLQATNNAAVAVMSLLVSRDLGLDVVWAGAALAVAAGLEVPALFVLGRLGRRVPDLVLLASGALVGVAYYAGMAVVSGPWSLIGLQVLNAWFFAAVVGTGLTFFQDVLPRPGLAAGIFANTRRVGAIVSGPIIAGGASSALGYSGVFALSAVMTVVALVLVVIAARSELTTTSSFEPR